MQKKQVAISPQGIQQDIAVTNFSPNFAYSLTNFRVITTGDNTSTILVNEKSNSLSLTVEGTIIGEQVINDFAVLFSTSSKEGEEADYIYIVKEEGDTLKFKKIDKTEGISDIPAGEPSYIFKGNLKLSVEHPLETIGLVERDDLYKVYWVDGVNMPRMLTLSSEVTIKDGDNTQFDFHKELQEAIYTNISVEPEFNTNGYFDAEVIQYGITYSDKYGQQTSLLFLSPLVYTSDYGRGLSPDGTQKASISFKIKLTNISDNYDYINLYRISRTSIDATPIVSLIGQYSTNFTTRIYTPTATKTYYSPSNIERTSFKIPEEPYIQADESIVSYITGREDITGTTIDGILWVVIPPDLKQGGGEGTSSDVTFTLTSGLNLVIPGKQTLVIRSNNASLQGVNGITFSSTDAIALYIADGVNDRGQLINQQAFSTYEDGFIVYDTNTTGEIVDPTSLLYSGGSLFTASTITHKDNTMFFGNIKLEGQYLNKGTKTHIKNNSSVEFIDSTDGRDINPSGGTSDYFYNSNIKESSADFTFYQKGETYRFGVQFLNKKGVWSDVAYIGDYPNDKRIKYNSSTEQFESRPLPRATIGIPEEIKNNYVSARLVCVYPSINDRTVLCQGILCPTVYNVGDRSSNSPYVQSSWFSRPNRVFPTENGVYLKEDSYHDGTFLENRMFTPNGNYNTVGIPLITGGLREHYLLTTTANGRLVSLRFSVSLLVGSVSENYFRIYIFPPQDYTTPYTIDAGDLEINENGLYQVNFTLDDTTTKDSILIGLGYGSNTSSGAATLINRSSYLEIDTAFLRENASYTSSGYISITVVYAAEDPVTFLPSNIYPNSEIYGAGQYAKGHLRNEAVNSYPNLYGVEKRIVTMHSPELDLVYNTDLYNMSLDGVKVRIVGYAPVKNSLSDINISYTNPMDSHVISGVYNDYIDSKIGYGYSLSSFPFWIDWLIGSENNMAIPNNSMTAASFPVYAWQRQSSLSNQGKTTDSGNRKSLLSRKVLSNLRSCYTNIYFDTDTQLEESYNVPLADIQLYNGESEDLVALNPWGESLYYRGNIDKVLTYDGTGTYDEAPNTIANFYYDVERSKIHDFLYGTYEGTPYTGSYILQYPRIKDYKGRSLWTSLEWLTNWSINEVNLFNSDPVSIKYKSTSHAVLAFDKDSEGKYTLLPTLSIIGKGSTSEAFGFTPYSSLNNVKDLIWLSNSELGSFKGVSQTNIQSSSFPVIGESEGDYSGFYYLVAELYRDNILNRFGGDSENALQNNTWVICSDSVNFSELGNNNQLIIIANQGDTMLGKYDHLKTYAYSNEDTNSVVDIISFYCETRINVDGRYDRNRGNQNNLAVSPTNFNLYNPVYSQRSGFYNPIYISEEETQVYNFPSQIAWSLTKTLGEQIDSWTSTTLSSILDLDGDKGPVNALRRFNNDIYAFQDTGISKVIFNPRVQINASDGVPIEISNSGKVEGKVYFTDKYGCQNKWSIVETPAGLYFIDGLNQAILNFNGNLTDISHSKGMYSWITNNSSDTIWNPKDFNSIRTLYDRGFSDIYFTTNDQSLAFSERLGQFSSFYDYEKVSFLFSLPENSYQVRANDNNQSEIWKLRGGEDYTTYFGKKSNYNLSVIANPEFQMDKIFDTVEFRTNGIEKFNYNKTDNYPFDWMLTTNEYQSAVSWASNIKKKFRTWRWAIGRDAKHSRDRIRNPWCKITMSGSRTEEMRLYDLVVTYYT